MTFTKPTNGSIETRLILAGSLRADDSKFQLTGVAASYNSLSQNLGGFKEKIAPGAFSRSLREKADVKCLVNHSPNLILGRTKSGTLVLSDSPQGLRFVCQLDRTNTDHCNTYAAVKRGDLSECSFAFTVPPGGDQWDDSDGTDPAVHAIRTLKDVNLLDVSAVAYPAYANAATSVSARAHRPAAYAPAVPSAQELDRLRRNLASAIGEKIRADELNARMLAAEDVSCMVRKALSDAFAGMGRKHRYVAHNDDFAYSLPEDVFDQDPDMSDEDCLRKASRWQYKINDKGEVELCAAPDKECQYMEGVSLQASGVLFQLREASVLRRRMRASAGIFTR